MTISLIVFVSLQFYWLKEYYASLEQEFSNKVHIALENSAQKISEIEFNKYNEKFKNFDQTLTSNAKKPTLFTVQQTQDSLSKTTLSFGKTIVEKQDIPISKKEIVLPSLNSTKMKVFIVLKKPTAPQIITSAQSQDISSGLFSLTEFAKFNASNLPINQRVNKKVLDSVLSEELKLQSIDSKFGYGILDKNNKLTSISNNTF
jgi:two-component system phosphate regulon sensor histidine kinase PhoR